MGNFNYVEKRLESSLWIAGNKFTMADIMMSFPLEIVERAGLTAKTHPKIFAWRARVAAMKSYQDALVKGGMKYQYAMKN